MTWNDRARTLTLEPGAPAGMRNDPTVRQFRVVLPDGTTRAVTYPGVRHVVEMTP